MGRKKLDNNELRTMVSLRMNPYKWGRLKEYCDKNNLNVTFVIEDLYTKMLKKEKWL